MSTQRDRPVSQLEITKTPWPVAPLNVFVSSAYIPGAFDIRWDDPSQQSPNRDFTLLGVNVYRSFDSEYGPYERLTTLPIGANYWRDRTDTERVEEDVSDSYTEFGLSDSASGFRYPRYVFKTLYPIVRPGSQGIFSSHPADVQVLVDGVEAAVKTVSGRTGEVELIPGPWADVAKQDVVDPVLPRAGSKTTISYVRLRSLVKTDLAQRVFYRIVTVGYDSDGNLMETPLEHAAASSNYEIEKLDYIWREAVSRNRWILEQGGERVKAFIRKSVGIPCRCIPDGHHKQPINDCVHCYGVGIEGGYEGPYDILVSPDDAERRIAQKDTGRTLEHMYEVWTGPTPLLSQRDFVVKQNGDRYSIGAVRMPSSRGMVLQQHFNLGHLDMQDIRYSVPMDRPRSVLEFKPSGPELEAGADITDKQNIPEDRQIKGRTPAWENQTW